MFPDRLNAFLDYPQAIVPNTETGPLAGLTLAVKDIFDVAGYPSGWGNPQRAAETGAASQSAPAVQALLDAGARFVGKTQTDELAFSLMGQNAHYANPINPNAPNRITGGSSSGSATAIAGGLCDVATGSDTGGSIRAPASFCGLVGLRTTHGAISLEGAMPLTPSLDTFGWFAKDMDTYRKVAKVLLGGTSVSRPIRLLRSPALDDLVLSPARGEYARIASQATDALGLTTTHSLPPQPIDDLYWCFRKVQSFEAWQSHGDWLSAKDRKLGAGVRERFEFGSSISAETYREETARRNAFTTWLGDALGNDGVLLLPTVPSCAPRSNEPHEELQSYREQALRLLCWSGLSGFPQITLPLGTVEAAPFGLSLLGPKNSDLKLLDLGSRICDSARAD